MTETVFDELRRYIGFGVSDEAILRRFLPHAIPHFDDIADEFYERALQHDQALRVFTSAEQVERHRRFLRDWLQSLLEGPWDAAYYERRIQIGQVHVRLELPQRFMSAALALIRVALAGVAERECQAAERSELLRALHKLLDIELAIMLESYRDAFISNVQQQERLERDDLRRRLVLSEARYEEIVEKADALITTLDHRGCVMLFNAKCENLCGISRSSAHGASWLELFVPEPDHDLVRARFEQALCGQVAASYEGPLPGDASEHRRVRWHFTTLPDGATPALCAIGIDVSTEHQLGVRMRRTERLAALGTMAAGLAHEIRNPLNAAHLQLSVAERRLQRGDANLAATKAAVTAAAGEMERLGALVQDFLEFAQPQALSLERVDLRRTVESTLGLLSREAERNNVAVTLVPGDQVDVEADREKIGQMLLNLVRNAIEATSAGGHVEVSVAARGPYAELVIHDDGAGIPTDSPVFEPFYTTKEHGTGLGLAIVHRIAMDHGGQVAVQSIPGDTRFSVSLPRNHAE